MKATYWMLAGLGMLTAVLVVVLASPQASAWYTGNQCPASGDWTVSSSTKYHDETVNVNGNLYVNSDLTLTNCGVRMNTASVDGGVTINVASGGSLTVYNSVITSNNGAYHYKFTVYGTLVINQSAINEMWGSTSSWDGGIQLYSNNAWIGNTSIYYGKTGGIYISKCSPWIYNNNIFGNGAAGTSTYAYGIYALGSGTTKMNITSNTIYTNTYSSGSYRYGYGIRAEYLNTSDAIYNNNIYDNGFQNTVSYNRGYQLYLYYSTPTITNNLFTNGQYQLYCYYSNPPTINRGTISGYARSSSTTYGVYATYSGLTFANVTFTTSNMGYTQYGIYATSYSPINVTDCTFDYRLYGSYTNYGIYASSYSPVNILRCLFTQTSYSTIYAVYASSYSDVSINDSRFVNNYGYYYGIYVSSYCKLALARSAMYSYDAYYSYMLQASSTSPVRLEGCTLDIEYNYYDARFIQARSSSGVTMNNTILNMYYANMYMSAYQMYAIYTYSSSPVTLSNVTATFEGNSCYYWYMFYVEGANLVINDTKITDTGNYIYYYYYMFYTGWSSGDLLINNVTVDFSARLSYQWGGIYITQGYNYGSAAKFDANKLILRGNFDGYFYGFYWGYGSISVNNSVIDLFGSGDGFYFTQAWYGDFMFRNTKITAETQGVQYGSILQDYCYGETKKFIVDNCTIVYKTSNTQGTQGGVGVFQQLDNMDADITNTSLTTINTDGVVPLQAFYVYNPFTLDIVDCTFKSVFGQGSGTSAPLVQWGWFYQTQLVNFTRCNITFDIIDEAMTLDTFFFYYGCGDLNLDRTNIYWNIDAAGSVVGMIIMSTDTWGPGSLDTFSLKNSKLNMVVDEPDCSLSLLKISPQTSITEFKVSESEVNLEFLVASDTTTTAIQISGSDVAISDLKLNLKAAAGTDTEIIGISVENAAPTLKNITVQGNGNGRISGILCSLAATPVIDGCRISNVHTGIAGDFFSMPYISKTTTESCSIGVGMQNFCNATVVGSTIKGKIAVQLMEAARVNMFQTSITGSVQDWMLNGSSTAWLLDCGFNPVVPSGDFLDANSRLIVNWYLTLWIKWQNGREISGATVVLRNAPGAEFMRATSEETGLVPKFIVVESVQTKAAKTMYSPYTVNASFGGVSGEQAVTTDRSKEENITIRDDIMPVVAITEPAAGTIQNFMTVTMFGTASDIGSGLDYMMTSHDGVNWKRQPATALWVDILEVPEGTRTLSVRLFDKAGNEGTAAREIVIDLTRPFIDVASPPDKSLGNTIGVDIVGSIEAGSTLTVNFRPAAVSPDGKFKYPVRLVEGRNEFVLFAKDPAGNTNTTTWTLYLDITPPPLTVTGPRDGLLTNQPTVPVAGRTEAGASVTVNNMAVDVNPDGSFSTVLNLTAGPNFVTVVASDAAGNRNTVLRSVVMDNVLKLEIADPEDRLVTTQVTILVTGSTDTDALVRLNDGIVSIDPDGDFSVTFTLNEGWNTLVFSATDRAGNTKSETRTVQLDTIAPVVELASPSNGAMLRDRNVAVSGICEPGINLTVNGQPVLDTATGVFNLTINLPEGTGRIVVEARDAAGNRVSLEIGITVDLTAPSLVIVEPSNDFRTVDRSVLVVGITEPGAKVTVNGMAAVVDQFGKFTVQLTLSKGANTVTATATDAAGNADTEKLTVRLVDTPASVEGGTWWWTAIGLLLALGIMIPLTMYMVNSWQKARIEKEGSK